MFAGFFCTSGLNNINFIIARYPGRFNFNCIVIFLQEKSKSRINNPVNILYINAKRCKFVGKLFISSCKEWRKALKTDESIAKK